MYPITIDDEDESTRNRRRRKLFKYHVDDIVTTKKNMTKQHRMFQNKISLVGYDDEEMQPLKIVKCMTRHGGTNGATLLPYYLLEDQKWRSELLLALRYCPHRTMTTNSNNKNLE